MTQAGPCSARAHSPGRGGEWHINTRPHRRSGTGSCWTDLRVRGFCRYQELSRAGTVPLCPPEEAELADRAGRYGATGPSSSLQLRWQRAKVNESGSSGGLLTQAARGQRSCGGLLSGGRPGEVLHKELGRSRCSLYLLESGSWHSCGLNPDLSGHESKSHPGTPEFHLRLFVPSPSRSRCRPSPRSTPSSRRLDPSRLTCCHSVWFTAKNPGLGVRKSRHSLTS